MSAKFEGKIEREFCLNEKKTGVIGSSFFSLSIRVVRFVFGITNDIYTLTTSCFGVEEDSPRSAHLVSCNRRGHLHR